MLIIVSIMTSTFIEPRRHKRDSKYSVHFSRVKDYHVSHRLREKIWSAAHGLLY